MIRLENYLSDVSFLIVCSCFALTWDLPINLEIRVVCRITFFNYFVFLIFILKSNLFDELAWDNNTLLMQN